ncbi:hypothetical protein AB0N05_29675 [Nocardia sp. NPDC051030]|uniref:hypothetical protein n=1 Tax=Nocardia sp. NPDC051030 TaxID=3155162 RepID=UPI0034242986
MSDTSGVNNRSRRRAVRSEGPPPEEKAVASPVFETTVKIAAADTVKLDKPVAEAPVEATPAAAVELTKSTGVEVTESTDADTAESEAPAAASAERGPMWMRIAAAVFVVLAVASLGASGFFLHERNVAADREAQRTEYTQFAREAMTSITNISGDTAPDDFARVLAVTSGDFAADLAKRKDDFSSVVQKAQVKTKGEVVETALESSDDRSAIVLVAVKQTLTNAGAEGPQQRQYRFRVTLARGDGDKLSVTGMEMVL